MRLWIFSAAILLPTVTFASVTLAQSIPSEVIIVRAASIGEALTSKESVRTVFDPLEVPFTVSTISEQTIAASGLTSLQDALRAVPGAAPVIGIGGFNTRFRLRGFATTNNLRNGFRQQLAFPILDVAAISQIDVLKGPASALYGRLEPGGAVNIITKEPKTTSFREFGLSADDQGLVRVTGDINFALSDGLALRLNTALDNGIGFRDYVDNRSVFVAPVVAFTNDTTRVVVEAGYNKREGVFDRGFVSAPLSLALPPQRFLGEPSDIFDNETLAASMRITRQISAKTTLKLGGSLGKSTSDGDYFFPIGIGGVPLVSATGVLNRRNQVTFDDQEDVSAGWELISSFKTGEIDHFWLVAGEWSKDESLSRISRATVNAPLSLSAPQYGAVRAPITANIIDTRSMNEGLGGLVQLESRIGDKLRTTVSIRADRLRARFTDNLTRVTGTSDESAVVPRIGVTYLPVKTIALFANWGQSFAPEAGTRPIIDQTSAKASRGEQFELGFRYHSNDERLKLSASTFSITRSNVRVGEAPPSPFDRQVGEQTSRGYEFDGAFQIHKAVSIETSYANVDAEVSRDRTLAGKVLQGVPRHSGHVLVRAALSPTLSAQVGGFYASKRFVDTANTFVLEGYERFDAGVTWAPNARFAFQLNVLNLGDVGYFENGNTNNNFYPGQPRTVRASLKVKL